MMDGLRGMNEAVAYIESRLADHIDIRNAASRAAMSEYHFRRMFSSLAGVTVSEYIRRRRLTLAALELQTQKVKVIDLALKYGYSSPDAFTRVFHAQHGVTPSEVSRNRLSVTSYPPMHFRLTVAGGNAMKYRIIQKDSFRIAGVMKRVPIIFEGVNPEIEAMWKALSEQELTEIASLSDIDPGGIIQASTHFSEGRMQEQGSLDHYIGAATARDVPDHLDVLEVPVMTWAIFESAGPFPQTLQQTWGRIYCEWFPSHPYQAADGPEILAVLSPDLAGKHVESEIWIPVEPLERS